VRNVYAPARLLTAVAIILVWIPTSSAHAQRVTEVEYLSIVDNLLSDTGPRSMHAAIDIRETYRPYVDLLALKDFDQIESGLANGGLVPLPVDTSRFNVRVRLDGTSPIAEKDLEHQVSYVSARAATIGCLLDVASQVKSGPVEVTSLVRHLDYQNELRSTSWSLPSASSWCFTSCRSRHGLDGTKTSTPVRSPASRGRIRSPCAKRR
jgi:hypothetical protein